MKNKVATTVKIEPELYDDFKVLGVRHKLTLQGLVEKTVWRYVKEEVFRVDMNNFTPYVITSSWASGLSSSISTVSVS